MANTDRYGTVYHPPMSLDEAMRSGALLAFEPEEGDEGRPIAQGFVLEGGFAYVDVGWHLDPSFHPMHVALGEVSGTGPWRVGRSMIRKVDHGDPLAAFFNDWLDRQESPETRDPGREECWKAILASQILEDEE